MRVGLLPVGSLPPTLLDELSTELAAYRVELERLPKRRSIRAVASIARKVSFAANRPRPGRRSWR